MSSVDNRIVQMEFDNKQFEAGIQTTLKSLEKLQEGLDLKGGTEGIKNIEKAVSRFDMSRMGNAVDSIAQHFTWLGRTIDHELDRITSKAIAAGEQMIKSLTIDQVSVGWDKYGDKTRSVATIMSATGKSVEEVNASLEKLNWFTDETSYNFTDMVNNVGKFTSVGVDLDDAVTAMEGIANVAALSGGGINEASRAMYNFSQAMGTGKLLLQDWKSIELANMATTEFKNTLIQSGLAMGTLVKQGDRYVTVTKDGTGAVASFKDANEGFRDSLSAGWITTDVMMDTFRRYGEYSDEIYKIVERDGVTAAEAMAMFSDSSMDLGERAFRAAQEARTFTDAINATKDAVSTGWMQSFEIIFGNYEQAKEMWTDLANTLWDVFAGGAERRNELLKETFQDARNIISLEDWNKVADDLPFTDTLRKAILDTARDHGIAIDQMYDDEAAFITLLANGQITTDMFNEALERTQGSATEASTGISEASGKLGELEDVARRVIRGDFGNGEERIRALTAAGYDYKQVQELVNKILRGEAIELENLSDEELKQLGYTDEQIEQLKTLRQVAQETGTPLNQLLQDLDRPTGRELMIEAATNAFHALMKVIGSVKEAWKDIFPPMTSDRLYEIIEKIRDFTASLIITDETSDKLTRGFRGLFSVLAIIVDVTKFAISGMVSLWNAIKPLLLVSFANLGDGLTNFYQKFKNSRIFEAIGNGISKTFLTLVRKIRQIKYFITSSLDASGILDPIKSKWEDIKDWINSKGGIAGVITTFFDLVNQWIRRINSVKIGTAIGSFINTVKEKFKGVTSIKDFIEKSFNVVTEFFSKVFNNIGGTFEKVKDFFEKGIKSIADGVEVGYGFLKNGATNFKKVFESFSSIIKNVLLLVSIWKLTKFIDSFTGVIDFLKGLLKDLSKGFKNLMGSIAKDFKANAILKIAAAIGILVASLYVLTNVVDPTRVYEALTIIGVLFAELALGVYAINKALGEGNAKGVKKIGGFLSLALGALVLVGVLSKLMKIDIVQLGKGLLELGVLLGILASFSNIASSDFKFSNGMALLTTAVSLQAFVLAMLEIAHMKPENAVKGLLGLGALLAEVAIFTRIAQNKIKFSNGFALFMIGLSLQAFVLAMLEIAHMKPENAVKGLLGLGALLAEVAIFTRIAQNKIKFSKGMALVGIAASMVTFATAIKKIGEIDTKSLIKGLAGLGVALVEVSILTNSMSKMSISSGLGSLMGIASLIVLIPLFKELSKIQDVEKLAISFSVAIIALAGAITLLKGVGVQGGLYAAAALLIFVAVITIIVTVIEVIAGLLAKLDGTIPFLEGARDVLGKVGEAIGALFGGISAGVISEVATSLGQLGTGLSDFWTNSSTFITGVKGLKKGDFDGFGGLAAAILQLTASEFLDALSRLIGFGKDNDLENFPSRMAALGKGLTSFSQETTEVNSDKVKMAAAALQSLAEIKAPPTDGFWQKVVGEKNYATFGTQLILLGAGLTSFAQSVSGIENFDVIKKAAQAIAEITSIEAPVTERGLVQLIMGGTNWGKFGSQLILLGAGLTSFYGSVKGIDNFDDIKNAIGVIGTLLSINNLPITERGLIQLFTGNTNWGKFGGQLTDFGTGFKSFATSMKGITEDDLSGVGPAVTAMKQLLEIDLPKTDGFFKWLVGQKDLGDFGDNLGKIGTGFATFNTNVGDVSVSNLTSIVGILERLGTFANSISPSIEENITNFANAMTLIDSSDLSMENALETLSEWNDDFELTGKTFGTSLKTSMKNHLLTTPADVLVEMTSIILAIGSYSASFVTSGVSMADAFGIGITSREKSLKEKAGKMVSSVVNSIRSARASFVTAGKFLAEGIEAGMMSRLRNVISAAVSLADAANNAFRLRLLIASPSRIMEQNGMFFTEGFVNGVQNGSKNVEDASKGLADSAIGSFQSSMSLIDGVINNTFDLQPTIRPVLDLSDVQSGAGSISSLFSQTQTIGLGGYQNPFIPNVLSQISSNMNNGMIGYTQNDNSDIIEAIRDLGNEFETIKDAISQMSVMMDSKALVGQIIGQVDSELGRRSQYNGRRH